MRAKGKELLLLRHAKSAWNTDTPTDFARRLNQRGGADAPQMGHWMKSQGLIPDAIFCSDAKRARQTIKAVVRVLNLPASSVHYDHRLYLPTEYELLEFVQELPERIKRPLIVGHNPGLDNLVRLLCGDALPRTATGKLLTTAALARISIAHDWRAVRAGLGTLDSLNRPREIRDSCAS